MRGGGSYRVPLYTYCRTLDRDNGRCRPNGKKKGLPTRYTVEGMAAAVGRDYGKITILILLLLSCAPAAAGRRRAHYNIPSMHHATGFFFVARKRWISANYVEIQIARAAVRVGQKPRFPRPDAFSVRVPFGPSSTTDPAAVHPRRPWIRKSPR